MDVVLAKALSPVWEGATGGIGDKKWGLFQATAFRCASAGAFTSGHGVLTLTSSSPTSQSKSTSVQLLQDISAGNRFRGVLSQDTTCSGHHCGRPISYGVDPSNLAATHSGNHRY